MLFPRSDAPFVQHGRFTLSGNDCIRIAKSLEQMRRSGYTTSDRHYVTLLSIFNFVVKFTQQRAKLVGQQSREDEPETFPTSQDQHHTLLWQMKALKSLMAKQPMAHEVQAALRTLQQPLHLRNYQWNASKEMVTSVGNGKDVCTEMLGTLCSNLHFQGIPDDVIVTERERLVQLKKEQRQRHLGELVARYKAEKKQVPMRIALQWKMLPLAQLQSALRSEIVTAMPAGDHRTRKQIREERQSRERQEKKVMLKRQREKRKQRKVFLNYVTSHAKNFHQTHLENKRTLARLSRGVEKHFKDLEDEKKSHERQAEMARIDALKRNNHEEYIKLLKEQKQTRLLALLKETDDYMNQLGSHIKKQQEEERGEKEQIELERKLAKAESANEVERIREHLEASRQRRKADQSGEDDDEGEHDLLHTRKKYLALAHAVKETITEQPTNLKGGTLREYQLQGLSWMVSLYNNQLNGILADEMGLGKTVQSVALIAYLMEAKHNFGPFLVIAPMSTLHNNWEYEFNRWLPSAKVIVYDGPKDTRKALRETRINQDDYNCLLTTYEFAMRDKRYLAKIKWEYIIIDEAHRLKNPKCKLAGELGHYWKRSRRVALTGTPLQNDLPELWALLNFLHPAIFNSCENFEKWFSSPFQNLGSADKEKHTEMSEEEKLLVIDRLHSILRPFMMRREKKGVEKQLAPKIEKVLRCELTQTQRIIYTAILDGTVKLQNRMVQMRKVCNHPYLFHPYVSGVAGSMQYTVGDDLLRICGKFSILDQILRKLKRTGHRVLIFNQMVKVMNILADYFVWAGYRFLRLDGNTSAELRKQNLETFNAKDSPYFIFMLSTKAGGLGLNLQSADTVILFDSDWNPQNDLQAQARAHRIGQMKQVLVLRLVTTGTVEDKILETANCKLDQEAMVIQAGIFNNAYRQDKSREILAQVMVKEKDTEDDEVVDDEEVSKAVARDETELALFREMDRERANLAKKLKYENADRVLPPNKVPQWLVGWCKRGARSNMTGQELVDANLIEFDTADIHAPTFAVDEYGKQRRSTRAKANYAQVDTDGDQSSSDGGKATKKRKTSDKQSGKRTSKGQRGKGKRRSKKDSQKDGKKTSRKEEASIKDNKGKQKKARKRKRKAQSSNSNSRGKKDNKRGAKPQIADGDNAELQKWMQVLLGGGVVSRLAYTTGKQWTDDVLKAVSSAEAIDAETETETEVDEEDDEDDEDARRANQAASQATKAAKLNKGKGKKERVRVKDKASKPTATKRAGRLPKKRAKRRIPRKSETAAKRILLMQAQATVPPTQASSKTRVKQEGGPTVRPAAKIGTRAEATVDHLSEGAAKASGSESSSGGSDSED